MSETVPLKYLGTNTNNNTNSLSPPPSKTSSSVTLQQLAHEFNLDGIATGLPNIKDEQQQQQHRSMSSSSLNDFNDDKYGNLLTTIIMGHRDDINSLLAGATNSLLEERLSNDKTIHPLYGRGACKWPGCELIFDDIQLFTKYV